MKLGNNKKENSKKTEDVITLTYSEKISSLLDQAEKMLIDSPQSIEVKGTLIHLHQAKGSLAQAGKFQKTSPTDKA